MNKNKFYITTPIYYPNGKPHIGHAFSTIYADTVCKYKKLFGYDAYMLTGMDEHGQKIEQAAKKANVDCQTFVDNNAKIFQDLWAKLNIDNFTFIRTTSKNHEEVVRKVFSYFYNENLIYKGLWKGLYCVSCEENISESASHKDEHGVLRCEHGHELVSKEEESYFFKMSKFQDWITDFYKNNPDFIIPNNRTKELINSFLSSSNSLQDLSVTRSNFDWGVKINEDNKHVVYVWIDALLNYLSAIGYNQTNHNLFDKLWLDDKTEIVHVMSKEITRFHCIYWPIMLHCLKLRQPSHIISHGWIITKEGKMSKSLGNVVDPYVLIDEYGADMLRYYLIKEIQIENDSVFDLNLFHETYNNDLANTFGNLVSRFHGMIWKYNKGIISKSGNLDSNSSELLNNIAQLNKQVTSLLKEYKISSIIKEVFLLAKQTNKFIEDLKPWELFKQNKFKEINNGLFVIANAIRVISIYLSPILTNGVKLINEQMLFSNKHLQIENVDNFDILDNHKILEINKPIYLRK